MNNVVVHKAKVGVPAVRMVQQQQQHQGGGWCRGAATMVMVKKVVVGRRRRMREQERSCCLVVSCSGARMTEEYNEGQKERENTATVGRTMAIMPDMLVRSVESGEDFQRVLQEQRGLVVLMCKAKGCRPCKQFGRKYEKLAGHFVDATFCDVFGDRNESTRGMMRSMKIRATPTFVFFRGGEVVHQHSGVNPQKMLDALKVAVQPGEAGYCEHLHFVNGVLTDDEEE